MVPTAASPTQGYPLRYAPPAHRVGVDVDRGLGPLGQRARAVHHRLPPQLRNLGLQLRQPGARGVAAGARGWARAGRSGVGVESGWVRTERAGEGETYGRECMAQRKLPLTCLFLQPPQSPYAPLPATHRGSSSTRPLPSIILMACSPAVILRLSAAGGEVVRRHLLASAGTGACRAAAATHAAGSGMLADSQRPLPRQALTLGDVEGVALRKVGGIDAALKHLPIEGRARGCVC